MRKVLDWRGAVRDSLFSWIILYTSDSLSNFCMPKSELELLWESREGRRGEQQDVSLSGSQQAAAGGVRTGNVH